MKHEPSFLFVADLQQARLLRCGQSASGLVHLEELEAFDAGWRESEHGRPSPLARRGVQAYGDRREREDLEHRSAVARKWADALQKVQNREHPNRILVLMPVSLISKVRERFPRPDASVAWEPCDLAPLNAGEMAQHPRVVRWATSPGAADAS